VNLTNLANAWSLVTPLCNGLTNVCNGISQGTTISTTALAPSAATIAAGTSVVLTATVTGSAGIPTGTVTFLVNGTVEGSGTLNASGIATYTYTTSCADLASLTLPELTPSGGGDGSIKRRSPQHIPWYAAGSGAPIVCLLLLALPRKRQLSGFLVLLLAVTLIAGTSGCGSSQSGPPATPPTNPNLPTPGLLILSASYSGNSTYSGSIASGISAAGFTTSSSTVTPIKVTVAVGSCTAI